MIAAEGLNQVLEGAFGRFHYLAPFVVLLLCGIGFPLPEEVTLIGAGILLHQGKVEFVPITLVCGAAILIGDSIPYWIGRKWGLKALRIRWVRRILRPERFARLEKRFEEHGNWATFACRFFAGVRIPGYFIAGTLGMSYVRFLLLDALGVLISVPISIYLGRVFGGSMDRLHESYRHLHLILAFLLLVLIAVMIVRSRRTKAALRAARAARDGEASKEDS